MPATQMRCYLPSTSALLVLAAIAYLALHGAARHTFAGAGLATTIVMALGIGGLLAGAIAVSATMTRRCRASAGACHTCRHPCREAMVPLPEIDTQRWPHRPLTRQPTLKLGNAAGDVPHV
jgi:hypothetical protein